jgi:hypothetical protein
MMLTADIGTLAAGAASRLYVLEFDVEYGRVQAFGEGEVYCSCNGRGEPYLESGQTGGCYSQPQTIGGVQLWNAEEHYLAVFADEAAMRAGGRQLTQAWGDQLPVCIHRVLDRDQPPAPER